MSKPETTPRRLYTMTGVLMLAGTDEVFSGIILATSEDEARGNHVAFMLKQRPGWLVHSCNVWRVPDALVREAVEALAND